MKFLNINIGELPEWVQVFGYLAAIFIIPAGKAILNYFRESSDKVIEDKKEALKQCYEKKEELRKENEQLKEAVANIKLEFSVMEGKVTMLKQFLNRDGYDNIEI